jgi:membrane protein implicated in regulation of membrane protease activity
MTSHYLYDGTIWLIIGLLFIFLELFEGSLLIFLPVGIGGLIVGLILKLQESSIIPVILIDLIWTSLAWAVLSLVTTFALRNYFKTKKPGKDSDRIGEDEDINQY